MYHTPNRKAWLALVEVCKNQHCRLSTFSNQFFLKGFSVKAFTFITVLFLILTFHANRRQTQLYLHITVIVADGALFS